MMNESGTFYRRDRGWHPPPLTPQYKTSILRSPQRAPLSLENTLSELTGPVFGHDILGKLDSDLIRNYAKTGDAIGPRINVYGRVLDENGRGVDGVYYRGKRKEDLSKAPEQDRELDYKYGQQELSPDEIPF